MINLLCFNPRTHIGCDLSCRYFPSCTEQFQSTHPHRVRHVFTHLETTITRFQSTHPHRVRLMVELGNIYCESFNPRTHIGCDAKNIDNATRAMEFQSTHPHRVRRLVVLWITATKSFNPRTHIGCDSLFQQYPQVSLGFNPRTHIGCDFLLIVIMSTENCFNPRTHIGCDLSFMS